MSFVYSFVYSFVCHLYVYRCWFDDGVDDGGRYVKTGRGLISVSWVLSNTAEHTSSG